MDVVWQQTYLEENKNKKFIDIEDMSQTLYDNYQEYRRKKYKVGNLMMMCTKS